MIKLIALDLDDTLLNRSKHIGCHTKDVIAEAQKKGIMFVPVTGRPLPGITDEVFEVLKPPYAVTMNGAVVTDMKKKKEVFVAGIDQTDKDMILNIAKKENADVEFFTGGDTYLSNELKDFLMFSYKDNPLYSYFEKTLHGINNIEEFMSNHIPEEIALIVKNSESRSRVIEDIGKMDSLKLFPVDLYVEIVSKEADKANGILRVASLCGIEKTEIMTVGDGINDIPMLSHPDFTSVAMSNACDQVKAAAKHITCDCDEDGVAKIIEKFVLKDL